MHWSRKRQGNDGRSNDADQFLAHLALRSLMQLG